MKKTPLALPETAPVMILPDSHLFPNVPLHLLIFEPRYRVILQWEIERDRAFCIATMKPPSPRRRGG